MDAETAHASGIPEEYLHELPNGTFVHRGMFVSFGPDANCTLDLCPIEWTVYEYRPMLGISIMFMALYFVALLIHIYLGIRWRSKSFMAFMIVGCVFPIVGYGGRIMLWVNPWSFGGFLLQMCLITTAPVFFTAAIYVTLSRAIQFFAPQISRLPPRLFYWSFIGADILCLILQGVGGALSTVSDGDSDTAVNIATAGLILQVIVIAIFCGFFVDYMVRFYRLRKRDPSAIKNDIGKYQRIFFGGLAVAIVLIQGRCIYRVEELSEGYTDSGKITHEGLFIGLEGVLMILATVALFFGHPGLGFRETNETGPQMLDAEKEASAESRELSSSSVNGVSNNV